MVLFPPNRESHLMVTQTASEIAKQAIVIVDDDESVRESLRRLMESEGFAVHAFSNGPELLNEASLPAMGCLVVDYQMPAMNGLELVSALRGLRGGLLVAVFPEIRLAELIEQPDVRRRSGLGDGDER